MIHNKILGAFLVLFLTPVSGIIAEEQLSLKESIDQRNERYSDNLEAYFQNEMVSQYEKRAADYWNRSYESIESFLASVEEGREGWRKVLSPPALEVSGPLKKEAYEPLADIHAEWVSLPLGFLKAEGVLAIPEGIDGPVPLVIAQHGIGSMPERVFGLLDSGNPYHEYGRALLKEGYAVLAPFNLRGVEPRNRIERLARLNGTSLPGLELARLQALLTEVLKDPRIDETRIGMWGISLGGMATMFWMPLEPRIKVGIVSAWFNHRRNKMVIPDERYSCFLETKEEHAFFQGWLTYFSDYDVVSLICPRPLLIQHGKKDRIAWWPQVLEEFAQSKEHYTKLNIGERIKMDLHEGGHEVQVVTGIQFLNRFLK